MLEKRVNIRASDYQLTDKRKYYEGYVNDKGAEVPGTAVRELVEIARAVTSPRAISKHAPNESSPLLSSGLASWAY